MVLLIVPPFDQTLSLEMWSKFKALAPTLNYPFVVLTAFVDTLCGPHRSGCFPLVCDIYRSQLQIHVPVLGDNLPGDEWL